MDWISYIREEFLKEDRGDWELTPIFSEPASASEIEAVEEKLGVAFHEEFRSLLSVTNGISEWMKTDKWEGDIGYFVWPLEQIEEQNLFFRSLEDYLDMYMPFDNLLFVAPAGNGDMFGYVILNDQIRKTDIFVWNHEDDSRVWVAPSFKKYVEWWSQGKISY